MKEDLSSWKSCRVNEVVTLWEELGEILVFDIWGSNEKIVNVWKAIIITEVNVHDSQYMSNIVFLECFFVFGVSNASNIESTEDL